ncbi:HAMP domain-containing histidine kinase [Myxococcota bacterium]|nr:HAMP domain-containing histidine kinase [Myxococcota bacterium]
MTTRPRPHGLLQRALGALGLGALFVAVALTGGAKSPILPFVVVPPMAAALFGRGALPVTWASMVFVVAIFLIELVGTDHPKPIPRYSTAILTAATGIFGTHVIRRARRRLEAGREESERLHREAVEAVTQRHTELVGVAGALAHQLKNPLAAVHGLATLLARRGEQDPELYDLADRARALNTAVHELLDFSRPSSESTLKRLVLADEVARLAAMSGQTVTVSGAADAEVLAEPRKLALVLSALLKAAGQGAKVDVSITVAGERVELALASDGREAGSRRGLRMAKLLAEQHGAVLEEARGPGLQVQLSWMGTKHMERP